MPTTRGWAVNVANSCEGGGRGVGGVVRMDGDARIHIRLSVRQGNGLPAGVQIVPDADESRHARRPGARQGFVSVVVKFGHIQMAVGVNEHRRAPLSAHSSRCVAVWQTRSRGVPSWSQCPVSLRRTPDVACLLISTTGSERGSAEGGSRRGVGRWRPRLRVKTESRADLVALQPYLGTLRGARARGNLGSKRSGRPGGSRRRDRRPVRRSEEEVTCEGPGDSRVRRRSPGPGRLWPCKLFRAGPPVQVRVRGPRVHFPPAALVTASINPAACGFDTSREMRIDEGLTSLL